MANMHARSSARALRAELSKDNMANMHARSSARALRAELSKDNMANMHARSSARALRAELSKDNMANMRARSSVRALRAELSKEQAGPHLQCRSSASQQLRGGCRGMAKMTLTARAHRPSQTFLAAMRARWGHPWQPWELLRAAASAAAVAASSLRCLKPNVVRTLVLDEKHTHSLPVSSHAPPLEGSST
jgi:hypothetical protein